MKYSYYLLFLFIVGLSCNSNENNSSNSESNDPVDNSILKQEVKEYSLNAKPNSISFNNQNTALIVVDMQNDFGTKGGLLDYIGIDISGVQKVVGPTKSVIEKAREIGIPIIYFKMGYEADLSDLGNEWSVNKNRKSHVGDTIIAPNGQISRIQIHNTWNTDIIDELKPYKSDIIVKKSRYSGFYNTNLDDILKVLKIRNILFVGCTTSICLESTVRDAMYRDYLSIVFSDCTAETISSGSPTSNYDASLLNILIMFG